jgi:hypothetical protein
MNGQKILASYSDDGRDKFEEIDPPTLQERIGDHFDHRALFVSLLFTIFVAIPFVSLLFFRILLFLVD